MTWRSLGDSNPCFRRERAKFRRYFMVAALFQHALDRAFGLRELRPRSARSTLARTIGQPPRFRPVNPRTKRVKTGRTRQTRLVFIGVFCRAFPSHGRGRRFNPYSAHHRSLQPSAHALLCAKGPPHSGQRTGAA
jgi:hypothetical protein